ncbi:MAG TPA: hypothetical protein PK988_00940 [Candidatus Sumerlaeota bacterium]|nr:hypothetical protein [Candidatus Sumerlaeota bacterium]
MSVLPRLVATIQLLLILAGIAAVARFHGSALSFGPTTGLLGAFVICAVGVGAASLSANIHYAARHLYNVHYAAIVGTVSVVWGLQILPALEIEWWLRAFLAGCLALSAPWTLMHLAASAANRRSTTLAIAAATMCAAFAALHPASIVLLTVLVGLSVLGVWLPTRKNDGEQPAPMASKSWGATAFLMLNLVVACGLGVMILIFFMHTYAIAVDGEAGVVVANAADFDFGNLSGAEGVLKLALARIAGSVAGLVLVPVSVFLWPTAVRSRTTMMLAAACMTTAAACGAQQSLVPGIVCGGISALLLCMATVACAEGARGTRWPHAIIAGAAAATILLQVFSGRLRNPSSSLVPFLLESLYLAILWCAAYFGGFRVIRVRADIAAGLVEKPAAPNSPRYRPPSLGQTPPHP